MNINEYEFREKISTYGYFITPNCFQKVEFEIIKNAIDTQYVEVIKKFSKCIPNNEIKNHFSKKFKVESYHEISRYLDHQKLWPKVNRILPKHFVEWFTQTSFYNFLLNFYGDIEISDEDEIGYPNIYWRLTRPGEGGDIGSLHKDSWFWQIDKDNGIDHPKYKRIKNWFSINTEKGKNGLLVVDKSHLDEKINWIKKDKNGFIKPILQDSKVEQEAFLLNTSPNTAVTFHDELIHGGAINKGKSTRVSFEFTLYIKNRKLF